MNDMAHEGGPGTDVIVSVVVPTFNGARYLAETLRAVLAQTQIGVELVVVDDGSSDNTLEVVRATAPTARVLSQGNAGVSAARNRGLAEARGRYVIFLDQDDIWHPEMLSLQARWLEDHPEHGAAVCRYCHWYPGTDGSYPAPATIWPPSPGLQADPDFTGWVYHQFLFDCWALTSGTLMRVGAVRARGGFDESLRYSEDWDLWLRLCRSTQFALLLWPPVLYRQHPVQGSRVPRAYDFRTELLLRNARLHGLVSADGRAMDPARFRELVAHYRFEFGYHHLQVGQRWVGVAALLRSWQMRPGQVRHLILALAGALGWRPR